MCHSFHSYHQRNVRSENLSVTFPFFHVGRFLALLSFFEALLTRGVGVNISPSSSSSLDHGAIIGPERELRYFVQRVPFPTNLVDNEDEFGSSDVDGTITLYGSTIIIEPRELIFKNNPVGLPFLKKMRIENKNLQNQNVQLLAISGNSAHFHCSFFADKVLSVGSNTTFEIVFLGREIGDVKNRLIIHTTLGSFDFLVRAEGTYNPYHLHPLLGLRLPMNYSYSPLIHLHNPHFEPLQVAEMISSGGDLVLEPPENESELTDEHWVIPPFEDKVIMRARFAARSELHHTAYIRIKTNITTAMFLYLPLEVTVSSEPGIYFPRDVLDFGTISEKSKSVPLGIINFSSYSVLIQNVIGLSETKDNQNTDGYEYNNNNNLIISFTPLRVDPGVEKQTVIAQLSFLPSSHQSGLIEGKIFVKWNETSLFVPYRVFILEGRLSFSFSSSESVPYFYINDFEDFGLVNLTVTNDFTLPLFLSSLSLSAEASEYFSIESFSPMILTSGQSANLSVISFKAKEARFQKQLESYLQIRSNLSSLHTIPLIFFDGVLDTFFPTSSSQEFLDFGTMGLGESRNIVFALINRNPVDVQILNWSSDVLVELVGSFPGNETQILRMTNFSLDSRQDTNPVLLKSHHFMVFRIFLSGQNEESQTKSFVSIMTKYQRIIVPFKYRVVHGSLNTLPSELVFSPTFPGEKSYLELKVISLFSQDMLMTSLTIIPPDDRFSFIDSSPNGKTLISSHKKTFLGKICFDPEVLCRRDSSCFVGLPFESSLGSIWANSLEVPSAKVDEEILRRLHESFKNASSSTSISLTLSTNIFHGFMYSAKAFQFWPRVTKSSSELHFPLTAIGNTSIMEVKITNPSSKLSLITQVIPLSFYKDFSIISQFPLSQKSHEGVLDDGFTILNDIKDEKDGEGQTEEYIKDLSSKVFQILSIVGSSGPLVSLSHSEIHSESKAFTLPPKSFAIIRCGFRPERKEDFKTALVVRNNLTGVEVIDVFLSGGSSSFKLNGYFPNQNFNLNFDLKDKHLKDCDKSKAHKYTSPIFTVKKSFVSRNDGNLPIWILGFTIDGLPCEGYGFKVLNCEPFRLDPHKERYITIAFTPDFTLSSITRSLSIESSYRSLNYTLEASVPHYWLSICSSVLPRPSWESRMYYMINGIMIFAISYVIATAYVESDGFLHRNYYSLLNSGGDPNESFSQTKKTLELISVRMMREESRREIDERDENDEKQIFIHPSYSVNSCTESLSRLLRTLVSFLRCPLNLSYYYFSRAPYNTSDSHFSSFSTLRKNETIEKEEKEYFLQSRKSINTLFKSSKKQKRGGGLKGKNEEVETCSSTTEASNVEELTDSLSSLKYPSQSSSSSPPKRKPLSKKNRRKKGGGGENKKISISDSSSSLSKEQLSSCKMSRKGGISSSRTTTSSLTQEEEEQEEEKNKKLDNKSNRVPSTSITTGTPSSSMTGKTKGSKTQGESLVGLNSKNNTESSIKGSGNTGSFSEKTPLRMSKSTPTQSSTPLLLPKDERLQNVGGVYKTKKVTLIGKVLPELKRPENLGSTFGPIGAPSHRTTTKGHSFHEDLIVNSSSCLTTSSSSTPTTYMNTNKSASESLRDFVSFENLEFPKGSLMQNLQAERRQRTQEYWIKRQTSDWPGFNSNPTQCFLETLWDSPSEIVFSERSRVSNSTWPSGPQESSFPTNLSSSSSPSSSSRIWKNGGGLDESSSLKERSWSSTLFHNH